MYWGKIALSNNQRHVGSSALALSISKILNLLLSMITSMLLARYLSLHEFGTYSELQTITSLAVSIFALGLPSSINYFLSSCNLEEKRKFLGFYYIAITTLAAVAAVLMFFSKELIAKYYANASITGFSFFLMIIPWTKIVISSRSNMLIVDAKIKRELIYSVSNSAVLLAITAMTIFRKASLRHYLWLYVVTEILFSLATYLEAYWSADKKLIVRFDKALLKSIIIFSVPLGISTAISTISLDLDKLIIGFFMDEDAVAIYANAGKELPFSLISSSFTAIVLPKVISNIKGNKHNEAVALWQLSSELCFIILCFCACASVVFAPQIIALLYSDVYLPGTGIFRIYSIVLLFRITYWGMLLNAYGKTKQILYNSLLCLGLNVILSICLYFLIGFEGPALASLLSIGLTAGSLLIRTSKLTKIKVTQIFPWKRVLLEFIVCILLAVVVGIVVKIIGLSADMRSIILAIIIGIVWAVIYFGIMFKRIKRIWREI